MEKKCNCKEPYDAEYFQGGYPYCPVHDKRKDTVTQLPVEVVEEIKAEAKLRGKNHMFIPMDGDYSSHKFHGFIVERTYETAATAYATKLHQVEQENEANENKIKLYEDALEKLHPQLSDLRQWKYTATKLLNEVFQKHETGLLPDRFIYEKIKTFLYGE